MGSQFWGLSDGQLKVYSTVYGSGKTWLAQGSSALWQRFASKGSGFGCREQDHGAQTAIGLSAAEESAEAMEPSRCQHPSCNRTDTIWILTACAHFDPDLMPEPLCIACGA